MRKGFFIVLAILSINTMIRQEIYASPPLPLHTFEGVGGIFMNPVAYLVNPPEEGFVGLPSIGVDTIWLGHKDFQSIHITETIFDRIELGYCYNNLHLGDLTRDIRRATGIDIKKHHIGLHHLNIRFLLLKEESFEQKWLPATTFGIHYKINDDLHGIDRRLGGVLRQHGCHDDSGVEFSLTATKMIKGLLPKPILLTFGLRESESAHLGLAGFTDDWHTTMEGSIAFFLTNRLIIGFEYRQNPDEIHEIPGLVGRQCDYYTVPIAFIINEHWTVSAGWGNMGKILNHEEENCFAFNMKWEF